MLNNKHFSDYYFKNDCVFNVHLCIFPFLSISLSICSFNNERFLNVIFTVHQKHSVF